MAYAAGYISNQINVCEAGVSDPDPPSRLKAELCPRRLTGMVDLFAIRPPSN
jgi:hypothetical protein